MTARKNETKNSATIGMLMALASLLGVLNIGFVSLLGAKLACGPPPVVVEPPKLQLKKMLFWKQSASPQKPPEASSFCRNVWSIVKYVPLLAPQEESLPPPIKETCNEEMKNPLQKLVSLFQRNKKKKSSSTLLEDTQLATAFTKVAPPTKSQEKLIHALAHDFRNYCVDDDHLDEKLKSVPWGGSQQHSPWWSGQDGGPTLLNSYLKVMNWPADLQTNFPFALCKQTCPSAFALAHTLQWRLVYQPWKMSPSAIHENRNGFVYVRGHAKSLQQQQPQHGKHHHEGHGHAMVWIRGGVHTSPPEPTSYFRALLNSLDKAIAENLQRSHNKVGKFNVVIDAHSASFQMLPKLGHVKKGIVMLQDHYPNRLGMIVLANFSRVAEFLLTMIKPLITKEVRDKIFILPKDAVKRREILQAIVEEEYIPDYLGGTDTYRFNVKEYYHDKSLQFSDEDARRYETEMPYHA